MFRKCLINYLTVLPKCLALVLETKLEEFDMQIRSVVQTRKSSLAKKTLF